ncbi:MAG: PIN domain-containing protein [Gemmatimonadetes bacterium]|nr:PIN domain-containing protein [Gemmatimonadota bacterium]
MRTFFDTNVLVYLFDEDAPANKARAQKLLEEEVSRGQAVLSTQVLQEFYVSVTRKLAEPLESEMAERAVRDLAVLPLIQIDAQMILAAIRRSRDFQHSFWDALIIEAAITSGADRLFTEDLQHGQLIESVRIENPFLIGTVGEPGSAGVGE